MTSFINLPGIGGSGEGHWQTIWEASDSRFCRFQPSSWDEPSLTDWVEALDRTITQRRAPVILVAHSLACLLVSHWANTRTVRIAGAFLVGVPDPMGSQFPKQAASFKAVPAVRLPFPALVVASSNDPYGTLIHARRRSDEWGCACIDIGEQGHINEASSLGVWQQGRLLLTAFAAGVGKSS